MIRALVPLIGLLAAMTGVPAVADTAACAGAADFDGDGVDDVVVGDPFGDEQKGAVHVLSAGKVVPVAVPGPAKGDGFGWSVRLAQVNGDACADLVVGAPYADVDGVEDAGAAYVIFGGQAAPPLLLTATQPQRFGHFGWSVAARGDLVAIGAPYEDEGDLPDAGAVYVRKGAGELRRISQESVDVRGNSEVGDQFGWSLAFGPENALVVGVPYENDDGLGRQVEDGKIDSGSVVLIDDVLAAKLASVKIDSPTGASGDRYGYAVAYAEGSGYAISSPGPGYVDLLGPDRKPVRRVEQGARRRSGSRWRPRRTAGWRSALPTGAACGWSLGRTRRRTGGWRTRTGCSARRWRSAATGCTWASRTPGRTAGSRWRAGTPRRSSRSSPRRAPTSASPSPAEAPLVRSPRRSTGGGDQAGSRPGADREQAGSRQGAGGGQVVGKRRSPQAGHCPCHRPPTCW
ncbi:hypothetical protein ACFQES_14485 [Nonomuraea salmonea]|uniref:hypothetical protein n=1 Tax=Nonomuraea salmonea TaxID=46181 RepID=UPI003620C406